MDSLFLKFIPFLSPCSREQVLSLVLTDDPCIIPSYYKGKGRQCVKLGHMGVAGRAEMVTQKPGHLLLPVQSFLFFHGPRQEGNTGSLGKLKEKLPIQEGLDTHLP